VNYIFCTKLWQKRDILTFQLFSRLYLEFVRDGFVTIAMVPDAGTIRIRNNRGRRKILNNKRNQAEKNQMNYLGLAVPEST
jgi:hypothetical protein